MKKGILFGVGTGPGDPELMTLKALRRINESDVLFFPAAEAESCRAYQIAVAAMPKLTEKDCRFFPFPMHMKTELLEEFHRNTAGEICKVLAQGKNAAFLTIGDPGIYSTFLYIQELVREAGFETSVVPGVPSFAACAAELGIALAAKEEEIHVIPGRGEIAAALQQKGTKVFMKSGKKLEELKQLLIEEEKKQDILVYSVSNCGYPDEICCRGAAKIPSEAGYLTVVIVKEN